MSVRALGAGFLESAERFPDRPALSIQDTSLSYSELREYAARIARTLQEVAPRDEPGERLTGVYGHRSFAAFAGVLGALFLGDGYVPLNPAFPRERTLAMLKRARLSRVVVEADSLESFVPVLEEVEEGITVLVPDREEACPLPESVSRHRFVFGSGLLGALTEPVRQVADEQLAYLLFTSGSTGQPKGVMVTQANVTRFVEVLTERYGVAETDRFSQTFDLTFDLSAFDLFVAWERGACVCCPTQGQKLLPSKYITSQAITIWFSVPATAILMKKLRMLKPGQYPTLRYSLFCGEALPLEVTEHFQQAAPNSVVENLYGPTELTIACTQYTYEKARAESEAELGVVPIGEPYPGMKVLIADESLAAVADGEPGELLMTGPQLSRGYWEDPEKTAAAFVVPPGESETYYRTGDRVRRRGAGGPLVYLGRMDNQIKVQGYRVELGEIEALVREVAGVDVAIAAGDPPGVKGAESIVVFMSPSDRAADTIQRALQDRLPSYMQPKKILTVETFPLNANGKVDRKALNHLYASGELG